MTLIRILLLCLACVFSWNCSRKDEAVATEQSPAALTDPSADKNAPHEPKTEEPARSRSQGSDPLDADDGSTGEEQKPYGSYDFVQRVLQRDRFGGESYVSPKFQTMTDGTFVLAVEAENGYSTDVRWNIYWIEPGTYKVKGTAVSSSALLRMETTKNNQLLTVEQRGGFKVYDATGTIKTTAQLEGIGWWYDVPVFKASGGRIYFGVPSGGQGIYVWDTTSGKLERHVLGTVPLFETADHKFIAIKTRSTPPLYWNIGVVVFLNENGIQTDEFTWDLTRMSNGFVGQTLTHRGTMILDVEYDPMHNRSRDHIFEIDFNNRKVLRDLKADTSEGRDLQRFVHAQPFKKNSVAYFDNSQVTIFDTNAKILRRAAFDHDTPYSFTVFANGTKILSSSHEIYDLKTFKYLNSLSSSGSGAVDPVYIPETDSFVAANRKGLSIFTPSAKTRPTTSGYRGICGTLGNTAERVDHCNFRVVLPSGKQWSLVTKRERNPSYGSSGQIGEVWKDETTGRLWSDTIENLNFGYAESIPFCQTERFHANTGRNWRMPTNAEVLESYRNGLYDVLPEGDRARPRSFYWFAQESGQKASVFDASTGQNVPWQGEARARCTGE